MNPVVWDSAFLDPLYGTLRFDEQLVNLVRTPAVQRLRHVRLSNIDSLDIPSIANLSRFEHVLGVAHLAGQVGFRPRLDAHDALVLDGSALLHDWAITSFGHLVEEGLQYVGASFNHERRLSEIVNGVGLEEVGGEDLQILQGRETGFKRWARKVAGSDGDRLLRDIMEHIRGRGRMGRVIAGDIDLDNLDNVFRMAFHMGLDIDRRLPARVARSIVDTTELGEPVFRRNVLPDVQSWCETRRSVYQHLMLSERDFTGKVMMLFATVKCYEHKELTAEDWKLLDHEFMTRLLSSSQRDVREAVERWLAGELWDMVAPRWMSGQRPDYPTLRAFSCAISDELGRACFAYGIKDKRDRLLGVTLDDGTRREFGRTANQWLLGIGSSSRRPFSRAEVRTALALAQSRFGSDPVEDQPQPTLQASLF